MSPEPDEVTKARLRKRISEERAKVMEHSNVAPGRFLDAWVRGVKMVGEGFFFHYTPSHHPHLNPAATLDEVTNKWQVSPNYDVIKERIGVLSSGEAKLLAVMCSFFNDGWGGDLMREMGVNGMADVASSLDLAGREIVGELLMYYTGW